jgi:hypothetical protein
MGAAELPVRVDTGPSRQSSTICSANRSLDSIILVHANQIGQWRKQLLDVLRKVFSDRRQKGDQEKDDLIKAGFKVSIVNLKLTPCDNPILTPLKLS